MIITLFSSYFIKLSISFILKFQHEVQQFYSAKQITVSGKNVPKPLFAFDEGSFPGESVP